MSILLFLSGCEKKEEVATKPETLVEKKQKEQKFSVTLNRTDGKNINLTQIENGFDFKEFQGKIVLINFFATWCPPCIYEIPHLNNLQKKYKDKLQIIGILLEEDKTLEEANNFIQKHSISYPVTYTAKNFNLATQLGGIDSIPTSILYDANGVYATHYNGAAPEEMIDADIQKVLNKQ